MHFLENPIEENKEIEKRIHDRIVLDCYDEYERASGWYCYLEDHLSFSFEATCRFKISTSPFKKGQTINVKKLAPGEICEHDMYVTAEFGDGTIDIPLRQVAPKNIDDKELIQAIRDWHYWCDRGYEF